MRRRARERQNKKEDRRLILKKLGAALLLSFRGCTAKNGLYEKGARGNWGHREAQQPFRPNPSGVVERTTTMRQLLIGAAKFCSLYILYCVHDRNFALYYSEILESIRVVGTDKRSVLMITVKVTLKSELVEDREGKFALYRVICCCDNMLLSRAVIRSHTV